MGCSVSTLIFHLSYRLKSLVDPVYGCTEPHQGRPGFCREDYGCDPSPARTPARNGVVRSGGGESCSCCAAAASRAGSNVTSIGATKSVRGGESGSHCLGAG